MAGTFPSRRAAFMLDNCSDILLEDLTIATDLHGQAEGLLLNGERIALYSVHNHRFRRCIASKRNNLYGVV